MTRLARTALLALAVFSTSALAHDRSVSYSSWEIAGADGRVTVSFSSLEASRLPLARGSEDDALADYLRERLVLSDGARPCTLVDGPRRLATPPGRVAFEWGVSCPSDGALVLESTLFLDVAPSHLHFARVRLGGSAPTERVLSEAEPAWVLGGADRGGGASGTGLAGYVKLGVLHILSGYDHLAFLAALLLVGGRLGDIARVVTGFTIAHSLTLALAVLCVVRPERGPVEALIGLSIALVAAENLWLAGGRRLLPAAGVVSCLALLAAAGAAGLGRVPALTLAGLGLFSACHLALVGRASSPVRLRAAVAFLFGLLHGFGFASVLLEVELPIARLAAALFGFNLGVEAGQLAAVCALWPLLRFLHAGEADAPRAALVDAASTAILALGVFWFASRAFG